MVISKPPLQPFELKTDIHPVKRLNVTYEISVTRHMITILLQPLDIFMLYLKKQSIIRFICCAHNHQISSCLYVCRNVMDK